MRRGKVYIMNDDMLVSFLDDSDIKREPLSCFPDGHKTPARSLDWMPLRARRSVGYSLYAENRRRERE